MEEAPLLLPAPEPSLSDQFGNLAQAIGTVQQSLAERERQQGTETGQALLGRRISRSRVEQHSAAGKPGGKPHPSLQTPPRPRAAPLLATPRLQQKETLPASALAERVGAIPTSGGRIEQTVGGMPVQAKQARGQDYADLESSQKAKEAQAAAPPRSEAELVLRGSEAEEVRRDVSDEPRSKSNPAAQQSLEELRQRAVAAVKLRRAEAARSESGKRSAQPQDSETAQLEKAQEADSRKDHASKAAGVHEQRQSQPQLSEAAIPLPEKDPAVGASKADERDAALRPEGQGHPSHMLALSKPARNFRQRKAASSVSGSLISSKPPEVTASPQSRPAKALAPASITHQPPSKKQRLEEQAFIPSHLPMPPDFPLPNNPATAGTSSSSDKGSPPRSRSRRRSEKRDRSPERRDRSPKQRESRDQSRRSTFPKLTYKERARERERERERKRDRDRDRELRRREESRRRDATPLRYSSRHKSPSPHRQRRSRSRRAATPDHDRRSKRARTRSPKSPSAKAQRSTRATPGTESLYL